MNAIRIEIAIDHVEAEQFCAWLNANGYDATIGQSTGCYIDGNRADINDLWEQYCDSI